MFPLCINLSKSLSSFQVLVYAKIVILIEPDSSQVFTKICPKKRILDIVELEKVSSEKQGEGYIS